MTLQSTEHVYQSDLMNVPPLADAMGFGLIGSWILNGLSYSYTGNNFTLQAGKAILQGRVFFLDTNRVFTVPTTAGTYYVTLSMDLSKTNTQTTTGVVTNNQFTLQLKQANDMVWGSAVEGDLNTDVALYKIISSGTTITSVTQITYPYYSSVDIPLTNKGFMTGSNILTFRRMGYQVTAQAYNDTGMRSGFTDYSFGTILSAGVMPIEYRPYKSLILVGGLSGQYASAAGEFNIATNGEISAYQVAKGWNLLSTSNPSTAGWLSFYFSYVSGAVANPSAI